MLSQSRIEDFLYESKKFFSSVFIIYNHPPHSQSGECDNVFVVACLFACPLQDILDWHTAAKPYENIPISVF